MALAGLSVASAAAVAATDSLLVAIGKLQGQINALASGKLDKGATAASADKLAAARTINEVPFDGTANITITAADPNSVNKTGDTFTGKFAVGSTASRDAGMYGTYDSAKTGHVWSMGTAYAIPADGSTFGTLYGLAYKHTNNATGGTMAGGHQIVVCQGGTAHVALGMAGGIWTSGNIYAGGTVS
ncbi:hypothetical protein [Pseudomonas anguilliseptica]|uniref:hypothetical protein n=1 Tax=Pseudomonas anguilliseptica TaxID=53406 RepID=UPI00325A8987